MTATPTTYHTAHQIATSLLQTGNYTDNPAPLTRDVTARMQADLGAYRILTAYGHGEIDAACTDAIDHYTRPTSRAGRPALLCMLIGHVDNAAGVCTRPGCQSVAFTGEIVAA